VAIRAILFDLGNTLVGYYTSSEFPLVLRRCLRECASALGPTADHARDENLFERVGWRKPHRAPFDRALSLLDVTPADALFVGDDHRWDIVGAQNAGLRPVLLESVVPKAGRDHLTIPNLAGIIALLTEASV
jgi:FMN phosphatase YigB (HAD superfamily)